VGRVGDRILREGLTKLLSRLPGRGKKERLTEVTSIEKCIGLNSLPGKLV